MTLLNLNSTPLNASSAGNVYPSWTVAGLRDAGLPEADILAAVQAHLAVAIDGRAEALRLSVMTPGAGQATEYQETVDQAREALDGAASGRPATAEVYPMLAASIGVDVDPATGGPALDVLGVARAVRAAYGRWLTFGAAIRAARLKGKAAVRAAVTVEAAVAAADDVVWPTAA